MQEVARRNSNFGLMQVLENFDGSRRFYLNDYLTQNTYDPEAKQSVSLFTYGLHGLAGVYTAQIKDVLCIGMGVGIVPMQFAHEGAQVDVVEINGAVVELARAHFDLQPEKLNLTIGDGRQFVNAATKQYDAVILDAFLGDSSPSHLMTREAFAAMRRVLRPEGVLVINSFGEFDAGKDYFAASLHKTLKAVFGSVRIHASGNGNVFYVASPAPELKQHRTMNFDAMHATVREQAREALAGIRDTNPQSGIVLTDDFNPVEFYDARNREQFRRQLAFSMRPR
jgi:spermidine synthase